MRARQRARAAEARAGVMVGEDEVVGQMQPGQQARPGQLHGQLAIAPRGQPEPVMVVEAGSNAKGAGILLDPTRNSQQHRGSCVWTSAPFLQM